VTRLVWPALALVLAVGSGDHGPRLREGLVLAAAGATAVNPPSCTAPAATMPSPLASTAPTVASAPSCLPRWSFTAPGGSTVDLIVQPIADGGPSPVSARLLRATGVETVGSIDVLVRESPAPPGARSLGQALFGCGKVMFNMTGEDAVAFARTLIPGLGC
jgi:hypothetical protein